MTTPHLNGFSSIQIESNLANLNKFKLVETAGRIKPIGSKNPTSSLRITTVGAYHLQRLPFMFAYYDAIATDIPIVDREYREKILDVEYIFDRIERGEILLSYLNACADQSLPPESGIEWPEMVQKTRLNIQYIKGILEKKA